MDALPKRLNFHLRPARQQRPDRLNAVSVEGEISYAQCEALMSIDARIFRRKVVVCILILLAVSFVSLCFMGAQGMYCVGSSAYQIYSPLDVFGVIRAHLYNLVASLTHLWNAHTTSWMVENVAGAYAIPEKAQVVLITILCGMLLSVSGMLYQTSFKNLLAAPTMLGASSGVSLGVMVLVVLYGSMATGMLVERYAFCYGLGAALMILSLVLCRCLSGKGRPLDFMALILLGAMLSRFVGSIVDFVTLYLMDESSYGMYYSISQMLTVDTSLFSWLTIICACVFCLIPVIVLRFQFNLLSFEDQEARSLGANLGILRLVALVLGGLMVLTAQVHVGMVGLVTLLVPFLVRGWFGCDFTKQLVGNMLVGAIFLVVSRVVCDMIVFVGDGLALGSLVSIIALPIVLVMFRKHLRGWE